MIYESIRTQVTEAARKMQEKGLVRGTSGNISVRGEDGRVLAITPSSIPYEMLTPDMVPVVGLDGLIVDAPHKPSSELPMHLQVMRARRDVGAVVHTHSKFATVLSIIGEPLSVCTIPLIEYAPVPAALVPYELPGSEALGTAVAGGLGENGKAVLLEMHGLLAVGTDICEAMRCAEYVEEGAEIAYYCRLALGRAPGIPADKVEEILAIRRTGRAI